MAEMNVHELREVERFEGDLAVVDLTDASPELFSQISESVKWWVAYEGPNRDEFFYGEGPAQVRFLRKPASG